MIQGTKHILRQAAEATLSEDLWPLLPEEIEVGTADAMDLMLTPRRFDIVAKYLYAKYREQVLDTNWGRRLYDEHIRAFNNYHEADASRKIGIDAFLDSYHSLLDDIKRNGCDPDRARVPVGADNVPADGAHRVAACALYGSSVPIVRIRKTDNYDYNFFLSRGLAAGWADAIAGEYCRLNTKAHIVNLYPAAVGREDAVRKILNEAGTMYYEKEVYLSNSGPTHYVKQVYEGEPWVGEASSGFKGARNKAKACFSRNGPLRIFVFVADSVDEVTEAKEAIRSLYGIGNHSVHINDTHEETRRLAGVLFNENSIHFLNHVEHRNFERFNRLLDAYQRWLTANELDREAFCIDASSVLSVYGIRQGHDLDYLHHGYDEMEHADPLIGSHNDHAGDYPTTIDDIIYNPENHFWYDGVKFASLDIVRRMKQSRGEEKDLLDIRAIDAHLKQSYALKLGITATKLRRKAIRSIKKRIGLK